MCPMSAPKLIHPSMADLDSEMRIEVYEYTKNFLGCKARRVTQITLCVKW